MKLFEEKLRARKSYSKHLENKYNYYDSSARTEIENIRNLLNNWFDNYPENEKTELKSRFETAFSSAFYELFLYTLFRKLKFDITIHPEIANSSKRPDFLIKNNEIEFYLEAKEVRDKTDEEEALEHMKNQIYDLLDEIDTPNFFIRIDDLIIKSKRQPAVAKLKKPIEKKLAELDPDILHAVRISEKNDSYAEMEFENEDLLLKLSPVPKSKEHRNRKDSRAIGIYPFENFKGGLEKSIKKSIMKKSNKYGKLDKPFIIALNITNGLINNEITVLNSVFGSLKYEINVETKEEEILREGDGIVYGKSGPQNKRINGFFVTNIFTDNIHDSTFWLIKHPYSEKELDFENLKLRYKFLESKKLIDVPGLTFKEIFNLSERWPFVV